MRKFIRHPAGVPIEIVAEKNLNSHSSNLTTVSFGGLSCIVCKVYELDKFVTIRIPIVDPVYQTKGKVIWCSNKEGAYEIGIQFVDAYDAFQCRMIEQICHIEQYRKDMEKKEGRMLSSQEAASEWILKYAAKFPGGIDDNS